MKYLWVVAVAMICGCGGADEERVTTISGLSGDATAGAVLYDAHCNRCHAPGGVGSPDGDDIRSSSKDQAIEAMLTGPDSMPIFDQLSDQELADIAAVVVTF